MRLKKGDPVRDRLKIMRRKGKIKRFVHLETPKSQSEHKKSLLAEVEEEETGREYTIPVSDLSHA